MDDVGATLGDQADLRPRSLAKLGAGVGGYGPEFLNGIERHAQHAGECGTILLVVDIHAVERHIGLVALAAVYCAAAEIVLILRVRLAEVGDARLKRKQADHVTRLEGQLGDRTVADGVPDGGVGRIHLNRFAAD